MAQSQQKNYLTIAGEITEIGPEIHIPRQGRDLYKRVITIVSPDGQKLFPEVRNNKMKLLEGVQVGDFATIEFSFEGSEKNDKIYNNIFLFSLRVV